VGENNSLKNGNLGGAFRERLVMLITIFADNQVVRYEKHRKGAIKYAVPFCPHFPTPYH